MNLPNIRVKKILYATDLSESARYAFAYAVSLADLYDASITILHVIVDDSFMAKGIVGYIGEDKWKTIMAQHEQDAKNILIGKKRDHALIKQGLEMFYEEMREKAKKRECDFTADEIVVLRGNPVDVIIEQSKERECDLVVIGTHGHGTIASAIVGSTAQRVIKRSDIPVLVVRLPEND